MDIKHFMKAPRALDAKTVASAIHHRTVFLLLKTYARTNEAWTEKVIAALSLTGIATVLPANDVSP